MATLNYRVHGVSTVSRPRKVTFEGDEIDAQIEGVEVDLVPTDDMSHGTLTLRFVGASAARARAEFSNGALGTITWTAVAGEATLVGSAPKA